MDKNFTTDWNEVRKHLLAILRDNSAQACDRVRAASVLLEIERKLDSEKWQVLT